MKILPCTRSVRCGDGSLDGCADVRYGSNQRRCMGDNDALPSNPHPTNSCFIFPCGMIRPLIISLSPQVRDRLNGYVFNFKIEQLSNRHSSKNPPRSHLPVQRRPLRKAVFSSQDRTE